MSMELHEAVKKLLDDFPDLQSAEGEIQVIGCVLHALKKSSYSGRKRILEYAGHWVESENKHKEIRDAEQKAVAASENSGRTKTRGAHRNHKYSHSQIVGLRKCLAKLKAERKSRRAAAKRLNGIVDSGHREDLARAAETSGVSEVAALTPKAGE